MISVNGLISLLFIVIGGYVLYGSLSRFSKLYNDQSPPGLWANDARFWKALIVPAILFLIPVINPLRLERIDTGHVGIKVNLAGNSRGVSNYEYKTGWFVYNTWVSQVKEIPTYIRPVQYDSIIVITKGGFPAVINPTFNYRVIPSSAGDMYQDLRVDLDQIEAHWLRTAITGSVNDISNKWAVDSIFNHRQNFENEIYAECNKRIGRWFTVDQLRTNIIPPHALVSQIELKTQAIQEEQTAINRAHTADAQAVEKIARARGDSADLVIRASAEGESIRRKQLTLTPEYIEYLKVLKWNGVLPTVQSGASTGLLMNLNK